MENCTVQAVHETYAASLSSLGQKTQLIFSLGKYFFRINTIKVHGFVLIYFPSRLFLHLKLRLFLQIFKQLVLAYKKKTSLFMKNFTKAYTLVSKEIGVRLVYFFFCFFLCCLSSWIYEKELLFLYLDPLLQLHQNVMYTSISDAFSTSLRLCIWISFFCCLPHALYSLFCFFLPSFFPCEKKKFYKMAFWVIFLYFASYGLCRFYIIPELCCWFLKFGVSTQGLYLSLQACVSNYVSWSGKMYLICFCFLEIPVGFWVLLELGLWQHKKVSTILSQNRKYTSLCILLICAIISPPDVYSQGTLFMFSIIVYEGFLWYSFLNEALKSQRKNTMS